MVECEDGYSRLGVSPQYSCGLNGTGIDWMFNGSGVICSQGKVATNTHSYTVIVILLQFLVSVSVIQRMVM